MRKGRTFGEGSYLLLLGRFAFSLGRSRSRPRPRGALRRRRTRARTGLPRRRAGPERGVAGEQRGVVAGALDAVGDERLDLGASDLHGTARVEEVVVAAG